MGHDHHHDHGAHAGHSHDHSHSPTHFKSCIDPKTCYCEVIRLAGAFCILMASTGLQIWVLQTFTSSFGGEGDVSHSYADGLYALALIPLLLYKRFHAGSAFRADLIGFCLNTALLLLAAAFILYRLVLGHQTMEIAPGPLAVVGVIGLVGNAGQLWVLGEIDWDDLSNIQGVAQHALYDMANSGAVIVDALVNAYFGGMTGKMFDQAVAFLIALSMLWTCWRNWEKIVEKIHAARL